MAKIINKVTTDYLDIALRMYGIQVSYEILSVVVDLVELIEQKGGEVCLSDIRDLKEERIMEQIKCITFNKKAQNLITTNIQKKMNGEKLSAEISNYFERELFEMINKFSSKGLKKSDLVRKMQYVTKSCELS
ncbi:MAG: hypothetical protein M0O93_06760 [Bacteroidales bacterium]|nr:hypothetical protein [Bacteroidales bacterium]